MKSRITQSDVARAAGVHNTTVSLALRNSPLIPAATRDRIRAIAKSMGYCPDPALQALVAYRRTCGPLKHGETLAYVTQGETQWGWRRQPLEEAYYRAATAKASELGYHVEPFWIGGGLTARRLGSVLRHRGIRGAIFAAPQGGGEEFAAFDWSQLTAVQIGERVTHPAVNRVALDPAGIVRLALQQVLYAGYRRVGLVLPHRWDKLTDQVWSAAFHAEQYRCHLKDRPPVLHLHSPLETEEEPSSHQAANDAASVLRWMRQYRPDAVLGSSGAVLAHLRRSGFQVPGDFAYADLLLTEPDGSSAGVWSDPSRMGEIAVETLITQLQQNAFGLPATATITSVGGTWRAGATLPGRPAAVPERTEVGAG